jgi:hypothetical protein
VVKDCKTRTFDCGPRRDDCAVIVATVDLTVDTMYLPTFEWVGDPSDPVLIDSNCEHLVGRMPWPLERLPHDRDWWSMCRKYIRTDSAYGYIYQRFHHDWWRMLYQFEKIGALLILTAQLWGWANVPPGARPSISHLGKRR